MAKPFTVAITDDGLAVMRNAAQIDAEAALDGVYVLRASLTAHTLDAAATVKAYKQRANAERAFRSLKTVDIEIRPIHHRRVDRVRAHVFLCMLAYYVEWRMRQALKPILFDDHDMAQAEGARTSIVPRPSAPRRRIARPSPSEPRTACPSTASVPCSLISPPSPATPWRWPPRPTPPS
jgi:Transposase DDE domain